MNKETCPDCWGSGKKFETLGINSTCFRCLGTGYIMKFDDLCPVCNGVGMNPYFSRACSFCSGNGTIMAPKITEKIPYTMKKLLLINRDK